ncbi:MAG: carboxypeptidase regulatory-like domain-containing protein [Bacteroidales bacterium]
MLRLACVFALCAALSLAEAAGARAPAAATIRGRVNIPNPLSAALPRPGIADLGRDTNYQPAAPRRAVVYLETAPQPAFEEGVAGRATMKQEHETFVPHVLAIRAGTVVDFPNGDPFFHNVFSLSKPQPFDLGRYAKGRSKSVQFDEPGIVRVFCEIHSHMSAFILVFSHRFFAVTDDDGRYRIERVPAGTYTLTAWYEAVAQQSRPVTVPEQGGAVDVDFTLRDR